MTIKTEVLQLSESIQGEIELDTNTGIGSEKSPGDAYKKNLPEGLTIEQVKTVNQYDANFIAASAHAFGQLSVKAMKDNDLAQTTASIKTVDKNRVNLTVDRERVYKDHLRDSGKETTRYGVVTVNYEVRAGKSTSGQLKQTRKEVSDLATQYFAKD